MTTTARVSQICRYPVKSMGGEALDKVFVGFSGVYGDRLYAIRSSACEAGFPYLTGREKSKLLLYKPRFQDPALAAHPEHIASATAIEPTLNTSHDDPSHLALDVETPDGERLAVDDPALLARVADGLSDKHTLSLMRSENGYTDCRPVSIISNQTIAQIGEELGEAIDPRRFRANILLDMAAEAGFQENDLIGRTIRIGARVEIRIVAKDPRCKMIALDPDTAKLTMKVLRHVASAHDGFAGVYGVVIEDGVINAGDEVTVT